MGRLANHLWRRAVELFLLACREGNDGTLPPVEEMAWTLRLSADKVLEDLHGLAEVWVLHDAQLGKWFVKHFRERQTSESYDRVKLYRERYSTGQSNGDVAAGASNSNSLSESFSDSVEEEGVWGEEEPQPLPISPAEAMLHQDVKVFTRVTAGRIPGLTQSRAVIETVRILRKKKQLDDQVLAVILAPYWLAWSTIKRLDGERYDPANISWLTEWALNDTIPIGRQKTKFRLMRR